VDCWRARREVSSVYQCGNSPECFKIFDPADEANGRAGSGVTFLIIGGVFIGMAVLVCACVFLTLFCRK